jgi:uncharacterized protein YycO
MVKMLDHQTRYSHVGVIEAGRVPHVIHIEPGSGTGDVVRREALADFLNPARADAFAVFRVSADHRNQARSATETARRYFASRLRFDPMFSLASADELYCSELVWRAYLAAGLDLLEGKVDRSFTGPVVLLSTLQHTRLMRRVY